MAEAEPTTPCPVERLARQVARLLDAASAMDEQALRLRAPWAEALAEKSRLLFDEADALKALAARERAMSVAGAMFQLGLLTLDLDDLADEPEPASTARIKARMLRQLYSVLHVLRGVAGADDRGLGLDHFLPARFDVAARAAELVSEAAA